LTISHGEPAIPSTLISGTAIGTDTATNTDQGAS
jgi:hypothetical protein